MSAEITNDQLRIALAKMLHPDAVLKLESGRWSATAPGDLKPGGVNCRTEDEAWSFIARWTADYPGDIAAAWSLFDEMVSQGRRIKIQFNADMEWEVSIFDGYATDEDPARAICLAVLRWKQAQL